MQEDHRKLYHNGDVAPIFTNAGVPPKEGPKTEGDEGRAKDELVRELKFYNLVGLAGPRLPFPLAQRVLGRLDK